MKLKFQFFLAVGNNLEIIWERTCYICRKSPKVIHYKKRTVDILAGHLAMSYSSLGFLNQINRLYHFDKMLNHGHGRYYMSFESKLN